MYFVITSTIKNYNLLYPRMNILASPSFILTFHYAGIDHDQSLEDKDVPYEVDKLVEEYDVPYQVWRIVGSCSGLERGGSFVESLDARTWEDLKKPIPNLTIRVYVSNIIQQYFDRHSVFTQA